ncbi:aminotransferase class I/II-fold pyridoxal phosphate-dependent enzyme [archaeon]|nr:MAG: aminotransferase class I/II-fold pyridoxal phosphate-dependent enzyme [archaeon]
MRRTPLAPWVAQGVVSASMRACTYTPTPPLHTCACLPCVAGCANAVRVPHRIARSALPCTVCRNPADVDILMGTFTKSFGAMGGYIAGSREFIDALRVSSAGFLIDNAMTPAVCSQILTAFKVMQGEDGTSIGAEKLQRLHDNANYFRNKLVDMGT